MSGWRMELETDPAPELRDAILRPLAAHNERQAGPGNWSLLAITVRDAAGQVAGGLWGVAATGSCSWSCSP